MTDYNNYSYTVTFYDNIISFLKSEYDGKSFIFTCEKELTNRNVQGLDTLSNKKKKKRKTTVQYIN